MAACEWCWARAWTREQTDTSKSQAKHYSEIVTEQNALGLLADCPMARHGARERRSTDAQADAR